MRCRRVVVVVVVAVATGVSADTIVRTVMGSGTQHLIVGFNIRVVLQDRPLGS